MKEGRNPKRSLEVKTLLLLLFAVVCIVFIVQSGRRPKEKELKLKHLKPIVSSFAFSDADWESAQVAADKDLAKWGERLFGDTALSKDGRQSCFACHDSTKNFTDGKKTSSGIHLLAKNSPTLINTRFQQRFFWNGRADSLASQVLGPLSHPDEQGLSHTGLARVIQQKYRKEYETFFGPWPKSLNAKVLATEARIPQRKVELSDAVAAYVLATVSYANLRTLLETAQKEGKKPSEIVNKYLLTPKLAEVKTQEAAFEKLPTNAQEDLKKVLMRITSALAAFQKNQIAMNSPFDRFVDVFRTSKTPEEAFHPTFGQTEYKGLRIFVEKNCHNCHSGPRFTDDQFHNTGLGPSAFGKFPDLGRSEGMLIAKADPFNCLGPYLTNGDKTEGCAELDFLNLDSLEAVGAFKTPTLRNVAKTAPYFHDGRADSLDEVIDHYQDLKAENVVGHREESLVPLNLTAEERDALRAFLNSLTSDITNLNL